MRKFIVGILPLSLVFAFVLLGCGKTPGTGTTSTSTPPGTVTMSSNNFVQHTVTINAGQAVHFDDPSATGGTHVICLGKDEVCDKTASGPTELQNDGFTITPGQTKDVVFDKPGTYDVTCSVHQNMNLTVIVK